MLERLTTETTVEELQEIAHDLQLLINQVLALAFERRLNANPTASPSQLKETAQN